MTIGFNTLFSQRDVRITPTSTATATAVGLTDPLYLTLATYADLVNERVLTAGAGIDFTDNGAGGTLVVEGEDSTAGNKGIVIVAGGEGMDVSYASGTATVAGEDATLTNKGIASFDTTHFIVTSGEAALNNTVVSAINDNTTHRGSDGSDHSLLANKTSYWSCSGIDFVIGDNQYNTALYLYNFPEGTLGLSGDITGGLGVSVNLPNGAVVTGAIVNGNAGAEDQTWTLIRLTRTTAATATMATAAVDTEDTSISNATIDNSLYSYFFSVDAVIGDCEIYGARIKYTTDYD